MPATGGSRAVHAPPSKPTDKGKMAQAAQPPRRESSAGTSAQRPGIKTRAYSAPNVPKSDTDGGSELDRTDEASEADEIADDAFFQRYHFPQPTTLSTQHEEGDSSAESSSDTEGPLSPTHHKDRQALDASEPSSVSPPIFIWRGDCSNLHM